MLPLFNRKNMCQISDKNYDISTHTLPPPASFTARQVKCFTTFTVESFQTEHLYDAYKLLRFY